MEIQIKKTQKRVAIFPFVTFLSHILSLSLADMASAYLHMLSPFTWFWRDEDGHRAAWRGRHVAHSAIKLWDLTALPKDT